MEKVLLSVAELTEKMSGFSHTYHLVDVHHDRDSYYAIDEESYMKPETYMCLNGYLLNLIMDGELEKARKFLNSLPDADMYKFLKIGMEIVFPAVTWAQFINDIKDFVRELFKKEKRMQPYASVQSMTFQKSMKDYLKNLKRSKEKKDEIDKLTKEFMRLIDWGEARGIKYTANLAAAEYTLLIKEYFTGQKKEPAERLEELCGAVLAAGALFEKALYDKEVLSKEEEKAFLNAVREVIK